MAITDRLPAVGNWMLNRRLEALLRTLVDNDPAADQQLVREAFALARRVHEHQRRKVDGAPYIVHPLAVAEACAERCMCAVSVAGALLHDSIEDSERGPLRVTRAMLEARFGADVAAIVDGATKLSRGEVEETADPSLETLRKLLVTAVTEDVRTIVIKVFDRWHNAETLDVHEEDRRRSIAEETVHFYVPIAHRLGFFKEARQLEDCVLRVLEPQTYRVVTARLARHERRVRRVVQRVSRDVEQALGKLGVTCTSRFYHKGIHTIVRELGAEHIPLDRLEEGCNFNLCLVVDDSNACFSALNVVHRHFVHLPGVLRDFINNPKVNGYQSLHTTCTGPGIPKLQVLIRTPEMDRANHLGVVSQLRAGRLHDVSWLDELVDSLTGLGGDALLEATARVAGPEIDVLTPRGEPRKLPKGATALDFAYEIHTEVGDGARGALVDGRARPLRTVLRSGQRVEIVTSDGAAPTWQRLDWVSTAKARNALKRTLDRRDAAGSRQAPDGLLTLCKRKLGVPLRPGEDLFEALLDSVGCEDAADLGRELFSGRLDFDHAVPHLVALLPEPALRRLTRVFRKEGILRGDEVEAALEAPEAERLRRVLGDMLCDHLSESAPPEPPLRIDGLRYPLQVRLAGCCRPEHGDAIVATTSRDRGATIHRSTCREIRMLVRHWPAQMARARWLGRRAPRPVRFELVGRDRRGLLAAVATVLAELRIDVQALEMHAEPDGSARGIAQVRLDRLVEPARVAHKLETVEGIVSAVAQG